MFIVTQRQKSLKRFYNSWTNQGHSIRKSKKKFFYGHQKTDLLIFLYFNTKTEICEEKKLYSYSEIFTFLKTEILVHFMKYSNFLIFCQNRNSGPLYTKKNFPKKSKNFFIFAEIEIFIYFFYFIFFLEIYIQTKIYKIL